MITVKHGYNNQCSVDVQGSWRFGDHAYAEGLVPPRYPVPSYVGRVYIVDFAVLILSPKQEDKYGYYFRSINGWWRE